MTHEFKTPISTIAISTAVLKDPSIVQAPERLLNYATIIENENFRLKQQVERVLQMARLEKEDIGLKKERQDVHGLIQEAISNNGLRLKADIQLQLEASNAKVMADKLHFINVLFNLLDNAVKYNERAPEIVIKTSNINGSIQIDVIDNGIGIRPEEQKKVFYRFYRVPTGNLHNVKGFGLGLSYVKLIVEAHQGKISVSSQPGNGSCFSIVLPVISLS